MQVIKSQDTKPVVEVKTVTTKTVTKNQAVRFSMKLARGLIALTSTMAVMSLSGCAKEGEPASLIGTSAHAEVSNTSETPQKNNSQQLDKALDSVGFESADSASNSANANIEKNAQQKTTAKNDIDNNFSDINEGIATPQETVADVIKGSKSVLRTANTLANASINHKKVPIRTELRENVSQQFLGMNDIEQRLIEVLPEIEYSTTDLSEFAQSVNHANWSESGRVDPATVIKIQALLNWHNHAVGAVDGKFSSNTVKAMQAFQKARGLKPTSKMNFLTWSMLSSNTELASRPVLVNYTLTKEDTSLKRQWGNKKNMQYRSVREKLGEKFHMSRALLYRLNPNVKFRAGNTITVYNPGQPNVTPVTRVEIYKRKNLLVAFDKNDKIVASYPTTIGVRSPSGTHYVANRIYRPHYNSDFKNKAKTLPPGPNNPVGLVWMGLSKPSFGIHGSPMPEMISRQRSHGCVRLTNWDALALYGTMQHRAKVSFKNS
ncbi:MAG: murein L,D-transpeptidase [Pseudomonadales bacterium]|nr:MAG: murein L,D-transpeptidase [Pseudomonadales bacterium]